MHRIPLIISILFLSLVSFAQHQGNIIVLGKISDPSGKPVEGVSVTDLNSANNCITDINGMYKISIKPQSTTLLFSYIGFKTVKKNISSAKIKKAIDGRIFIDVKLEQEVYTLSGVDISGKAYEWAYKNPKAWITDYEFINDTGILLLMIENQRHFLRIVNEHSNVLHDYNIKVRNARFFRDCFNNIHMLTNNTTNQIYIFDSLGIYVYPDQSISTFREVLYPCICNDNNSLYFIKYFDFNQIVVLYKINMTTKQKVTIYYVINQNNITINRDIVSEIIKLKSNSGSYKDLSNNNPDNEVENPAELGYDIMDSWLSAEEKNNRKVRDLRYTLFLYTRPVKLDVLYLNDSIFVIDHFNYKMLVFGVDSSIIRSVDLDRNNYDLAHSVIFTDFENKRIFLTYSVNGIANIKELNLSDLSIKREFKISEHIHPQKIKIRGDYVYYLYGGIINEAKKYLYKEKLN
jgi:hypothetical protein